VAWQGKGWAGTLTAGVLFALSLLASATSAPAEVERQGQGLTATIKMKLGEVPRFVGPDEVAAGQTLRILNQTRPRDTGPHFFSLFAENALPEDGEETRQCLNLELPQCKQVASAHKISRQFRVRRPDIDNGRGGWDAVFTPDEQGDTWFTNGRGQSEARVVSAAPGTTLYYYCLLQPPMRGSIDVTADSP
jgi:hypothetical protein